MKKKDLLDLQIITSLLFIGTIIVSIILNYNKKYNNKYISKKDELIINKYNRLIATILVLSYLYINYNTYEEDLFNNKNINRDIAQLIASGLVAIAAFIVLYLSFTAREESSSFGENPDI